MPTTRQCTVVTLEAALLVIQRAIAEAETRDVQASVAIVDPGMNLIAFAKADGATPHSVYSSRSKANTAASTRRPTGWMGDDLALSIPLATELKLTNIKGGSPAQLRRGSKRRDRGRRRDPRSGCGDCCSRCGLRVGSLNGILHTE
jgi:glc operon protein GlcG